MERRPECVGAAVALRLPDHPRPGGETLETGALITLIPDQTIHTAERYLIVEHLERYLHLMGTHGWRLGREIPPVQLVPVAGRYWHFDGKHRIAVARLLDLPLRARLRRVTAGDA
jgi:hypothetical protein